jgi:hypothetical protein
LTLPDAPALMVIHEVLLVAVHAQPVAAVTVTVPVAAAAVVRVLDVGEIVGAHATPDCVTVNVAPPTVSVPVRLDATLFAATVNETVPVPVPADPALTEIHGALLTAVHAQPTEAVAVVLPEPPAAPKLWLAGAIVGGHGPLNANVFDRALAAMPPGPTALTAVS